MTEKIEGIIRRRRDLGKVLCFIDLETQGCSLDNFRKQLVIDGWKAPRNAIFGARIICEGRIEEKTGRFLVNEDHLTVEDQSAKDESKWGIASMHKEWRRTIGINSKDWEDRKMKKKETKQVTEAHHSLASKSKHNRIFVTWLLKTYGAEWLKANGGIVDIAGGTGALALELTLEHDIPTVLIEPKTLKLNTTNRKRCRKWRKKHNLEIVEKEGSINLAPITHLETEFHGISSSEGECAPEVLLALQDCAIIVGMHPDQATGAIVEAAILLGKPWAIVPCCVFGHLFPYRMTPDGRTVTQYDELCTWIEGLGGLGSRREALPFEGRNAVIYCTSLAPPLA